MADDYLSIVNAANKQSEARRQKSNAWVSALVQSGAFNQAEDAVQSDTASPGKLKAQLTSVAVAHGASNWKEVQAWMEKQMRNPSSNWYRQCQNFARQAIGAPAGAPTAADAYYRSSDKHKDQNAPAGTVLYWGGGAGHAAVSDGNGGAYSTDVSGNGRIGHVSIARLNQWLGPKHPILGWTGNVNGKQVKYK